MKKLLSVCLVLIMMLSIFSVTASAETISGSIDELYFNVLIDDVYYVLMDGTAIVSGFAFDEYDVSPKPGIVIPETVTHKDSSFTVSIILPEAFSLCNYTSVTLPSTLSYMGDGAFMSSPYLENVVIPENCEFEYFGGNVFIDTPFEAEIYLKDETIFGKNVLYSYIGNADEYVIPSNIEILAPFSFFMSGVKSIVFNDKITAIPSCAFASCRNLKEINIPDSVESIADGAFKDCTSLEKITVGENVGTLGVGCFSNTKIKNFHIGPNLIDFNGAFNDCKTLESVTIDEANTFFITDGNAIYSKSTFYFGNDEREGLLLEYYVPSNVQENLTLKTDVCAIGAYAFYGCKGINEVVAKELEYVDSYAFYNSSIKKFTAKGEYMIFDAAFKNCKNLETINLEKVNHIGAAAFENCTSLQKVEFSDSIYIIDALAFSNSGLKDVTIYGDDCYIYESAFKGCKNLETVTLEEGVAYIDVNAFLNCPELKSIYLSKTVKEIQDNAFNGCDNVTFKLIKGTTAYKFIKNNTDFNFEVVGNYSIFQRIIDFFISLFFWF